MLKYCLVNRGDLAMLVSATRNAWDLLLQIGTSN